MYIVNEGEAGLPTTESVMEGLLRTVGTHYTLGHEIWKFYRELIQQDDETSSLQKEQTMRAFYVRQMTLPLQQNDLVMSEFRAWNNYNTLEPDTKRRETLFEDAVARQTKGFGPLMKKMNQFEERLQAAVSGQNLPDEVLPLDQIWLQYVNFVTYRIVPLMQVDEEKIEGSLITGDDLLKCMYERAVAMMCLSSTLWSTYATFLSGSATISSDTEKLALYQRAVRNVSFDSSMWNDLLLEMERQGASVAQLSAFFSRKIASRTNPLMMDAYHFLSVLITYCDVHRREAACKKFNRPAMQQLDQMFQLCEQFCADHFPDFPLGRTRIMEYHAKCSLLGFPSTTASRFSTNFVKWNALWDEILHLRDHEAEVWVSYYQESARTGAKSTAQDIRAGVFQRAMQVVTDYPASILELWLVFERENGTLSDFLHVRQLHADFVAKAAASAAAQAAEVAAASAEAPVQPESRKRKAVESKSKPEPKRAKPSPVPRQKEEEPKPKTQQQAAKKVVAPEKIVEKKKTHEALTNAHTLFASNISKDVTKEELDALFQGIPGFKELRLVVKARANHIKSRGMAYIQFSDEQGVEAGLLKNGLELKGQAMSIEKSKPPQATSGDDANKGKNGDLSRDGTWKTDPVTIYVGGLVQKATGEHIGEAKLQEGIQQALQSVGELVVVKRVSILKDKRGKLKDYGLVEVAAPEQVGKCVEHLKEIQSILDDQITLKPSRFSIDQILLQQQNQMKKKETTGPSKASDEKKHKPKGNAGAGGAGAPHASAQAASKPRMNTMSLMPRALRRKQLAVSADATSVSALRANNTAPAAKKATGSLNQQTTQPPATTAASDNRPKTNDDFRKLMMKQ